jgi:hypothetical protein
MSRKRKKQQERFCMEEAPEYVRWSHLDQPNSDGLKWALVACGNGRTVCVRQIPYTPGLHVCVYEQEYESFILFKLKCMIEYPEHGMIASRCYEFPLGVCVDETLVPAEPKHLGSIASDFLTCDLDEFDEQISTDY